MLEITFNSIYFFITLVLFKIDLKYYKLPFSLTLSLIFLGLLKAYFFNNLKIHLIAFILAAFIFIIIYVISFLIYKKEALGLGDCLLACGIGSFWGINHIFYTIYYSFIFGGFYAVYLLIFTSKLKHHIIPFGPFLILSSWANHLYFQIWF